MNLRFFSSTLRTLCVAAFAVAFLLTFFASPLAAQRLPDTVVPTHYKLAFTPDLRSATFSCTESVDIHIEQPTRTITLNAIEIAFQSVTISANGAQQNATVSLDPEKQQATFTFPADVPAGNATISIQFTGILNNELRGFYLSKTAKRNYAVTQFESTDARRAFPCFDEPAFKATFDISLVIDDGDTAISNSAIVSDAPGPEAGKHTLRFDTTPRMSTYLVAFLVGDFKCTAGQSEGVDIRVCVTPDKLALTQFPLDVAKFTLHYYNDYFGIRYPLKKLDLIGIPDFEAGAMENFGAITYRESDLLLDPQTASIDSKVNVALVVTHEMAHQWFGDLVTMKWWDNVWLNEGFATWMENKPVAAMHPEWDIPEIVANNEQNTLNYDAQPTTRAIRARADTPDEINQMFDGIAYGKASDVLLMVENYLGAETFRKGVQAYLKAHEYSNATAEDFWNAQTAVSHKPVDKIMESLVAQPGVPLLKFSEAGNGAAAVTQRRFFLSPSIQPDPKQKWTLPVCFKTAAGTDCKLLTPTDSVLRVGDRFFFADANGKGYYRSAYPAGVYSQLVDKVETFLTPAERISLVGDEWAQMRANTATVGDYLSLVDALKSDPKSAVISSAIGNLSIIADRVASSDAERDQLGAWVHRSFGPRYAKLGPPAAGDSPNTIQLRAILLSALGYLGSDPAVLEQARRLADQYLADPGSVDPTLAETALGVAAEHGDAALFDRLQQIYETSNNPDMRDRALQELATFTNPDLLHRALEYAVSAKVRNQDTWIQFSIGLQVPENRDATWQFIKTHWNQVQAQLTTDSGAALVSRTGNFCTVEARDDVKNFFTAHPVSSASVSLKHALDAIDNCVELRRLQEPNLKQWLAANAAQ